MKSFRNPFVFAFLFFLLFAGALKYSAAAQNPSENSRESVVSLQVSANDEIAAEDIVAHHVHLHPMRSQSGAHVRFEDPEIGKRNAGLNSSAASSAQSEAAAQLSIPNVSSPGFYPADVSNPTHGKTLQMVQSNNVYVNCPPSCWGNAANTPATFLGKLDASTFIHVTDEYVRSTASNRYTIGTASSINTSLPTKLTPSNILQLVHTAAKAHGSGYDHVYHIFLRSGVDVCTSANVCYSPDNNSTFAFCAYHASADFTDIGHVLYSVEPFQNVPGCAVSQPSPNGALIDSTASTLSHELIETITDPDGDAWIAQNSLIEFGAEVADICENPFGKNSAFLISGKSYAIQSEYSNKYHACSTTP